MHLNQNLQAVAEDIAVRAAQAVREKRAELGDIAAYTQTKSSTVDPVTVVDTFAEDFIVTELGSLRPGDGVIGEEGSESHSQTGITWIIDPIDGTVNFLYGIPQFAVSIAAALNGEVIAGAVINVTTNALYSAAAGFGAIRKQDGTVAELHANKVTDLGQVLLATGFGYSASRREKQAALVANLLPQVRDIRRMGSAALDLCAVAEGQVDAHFEHGLNAWDYAAGGLIAQEAGAEIHVPPLSSSGDAGELTLAAAPGVFVSLWDAVSAIGGTDAIGR